MLELYHWEPNGVSARVLLCLAEKGLPFQRHYVDVLALEQHQPAFIALSREGQVPVLVHDGEPFTDATLICEYLEDVFVGRRLMPVDAEGRWRVRVWQKYVDELMGPAVTHIAWSIFRPWTGPVLDAVKTAPTEDSRQAWRQALAGYGDAMLVADRAEIDTAVGKLEGALAQSRWLVGPELTLADIAVFSYARYIPKVLPELLGAERAPRTSAWLDRMSSRDAFREVSQLGRAKAPFLMAAPGPERLRWG